MKYVILLFICFGLVFSFLGISGCKQKPEEEITPSEVTQPDTKTGIMEKGQEVMDKGKEMLSEGAMMEKGQEVMDKGKEMLSEGGMMEKGKEMMPEDSMMEKGKEMLNIK